MFDITHRYTEAYKVVRFIIRLARRVQFLGMFVGGFSVLLAAYYLLTILFAGVITREFGTWAQIVGTLVTFGLLPALFGYIVSIFLNALGQMLLAVLDTAINTSPFLSLEGKARILGATQDDAGGSNEPPPSSPVCNSL